MSVHSTHLYDHHNCRCAACRAAKRQAQAEWRRQNPEAAAASQRRQYRRQRARMRALRRLAGMYLTDYQALVREEYRADGVE